MKFSSIFTGFDGAGMEALLGRKGLRLSDNPYADDNLGSGETALERWDRERREMACHEILRAWDRHTRLALEGEFVKAIHLIDHPGEVKWTSPGEMPRPEIMAAARKYLGRK